MAVREAESGKALLLLFFLLRGCIVASQRSAAPPNPARAPIPPGQPFLVLWSIPDAACQRRPDPAAFGIQREGRVSFFYEDTLGLYPFYDSQNQPVSGGLPQHTSLSEHLQKVEADILDALPSAKAQVLGVICWDEWASQWGRNRGKQEVYQQESRSLLRRFFPEWSPDEVAKWAQVDFEAAAQSIVMETLQEVRRIRPQVLWGMASYPSCYNSGLDRRLENYTGRCPATEIALNNELQWLWKRSSALFPTLLLDKLLGHTEAARLYASNQLREALRVAALSGSAYDLPVFPLLRSVYISTKTFFTEADLVNTIGESAAMGAAGVIIWDKFFSAKTQKACWELANFVGEVLGPYAVNVTTAARLCSEVLCQGRGRCIRKNSEVPSYLHLSPTSFLLLAEGNDGLQAIGELAPEDLERWRRDFQCHWYEALDGTAADEESPMTASNGRGRKAPMLTEQFTVAGPTVAGPTEAKLETAGHKSRLPTEATSGTMVTPTASSQHQSPPPSTSLLFTLLLVALPSLTYT